MRLQHLNNSEMDVWPAFTDFLTSVLIIVVIFVFGILFSNVARNLVQQHSEFEDMQLDQKLVHQQMLNQLGPKNVEVSENGSLQRIVLRLNDEGGGGVLFASGKSDLSEAGKGLLSKIAGVLLKNATRYDKIQVEGHTDDVPLNGAMSNWELSAARAGAVVKFMIDESKSPTSPGLEPWRFSANGAAEYHPYKVPESAMNLKPMANPRNGPPLEYVVQANQTTQEVSSTNPLADNFARQRNRRIEIVLTYRVRQRNVVRTGD
jgi:flagellar motor protein MotB